MVGAGKIEGNNVMMRSLSFAATAAAATILCGMAAHAGCADSKNLAPGSVHLIPSQVLQAMAGTHNQGSRGDASDNIVGTWFVTYTAGGNPFGQAYIQWHSDGTEWENIDFPISGGNICLGSWKPVDLKHVYRNHWGWLYTNGEVSGYFNETETDKVTRSGTYAGTNETKGYDLNGNLLFDVTGTSSAVLISP